MVVWLSILTLAFPAFGTDRYVSSQPLGVITAYDCIDYLDAQPKMQYVNAPKTSSPTQPNSTSNIHQTGSEHGPGTSSPLYILNQRKTLQRSTTVELQCGSVVRDCCSVILVLLSSHTSITEA
jgi:hypothetical protein